MGSARRLRLATTRRVLTTINSAQHRTLSQTGTPLRMGTYDIPAQQAATVPSSFGRVDYQRLKSSRLMMKLTQADAIAAARITALNQNMAVSGTSEQHRRLSRGAPAPWDFHKRERCGR